MAFTTPSLAVAGSVLTAAFLNTNYRLNFLECPAAKATAQGQIFYVSTTGVVVALTPGTSGQFLQTLGAAANPAWASQAITRKSYSTATAAASILVSSLVLATDLEYLIVVHCNGLSGADYLQFKVNDGLAGQHFYNCSDVATTTEAHTTGSGVNIWNLTGVSTARGFRAWIRVGIITNETAARPMADWNAAGFTDGAGPLHAEGHGSVTGATTMTSFRVLTQGGATANWKVWVFSLPIA